MRALPMAPRPSGGVAHAMAVSVEVSVRDGKQSGEKRLVFARRLHTIASTFSRTKSFRISWKMWVHKRGVFMCVSQLKRLPEIVLEIVSHVASIWHPSRLARV